MSKHTAGPWKATTSWRDTDCTRLAYVAVHNMDGGDEIAACRNARRDRQADAARIVACVNALDGIDDPLIFVSAATTLLGFAAAHTGSGCRTGGESVAADVTINDPAYLADVVDTMRRCLSGGER